MHGIHFIPRFCPQNPAPGAADWPPAQSGRTPEFGHGPLLVHECTNMLIAHCCFKFHSTHTDTARNAVYTILIIGAFTVMSAYTLQSPSTNHHVNEL